MAGKIFLGSKFKSFKADGSVNAAGTVEFFEPGGTFSVYKTTYSDSDLSVANENIIELDAGGEADIWMSGNYDVRIKNSVGVVLDTFLNINPDESSSSTGFNLLDNGSFEIDTNGDGTPDSWDVATYTGGTAAVDDTDRNHGANSMKFTTTGNGGGNMTQSNFFPVEPNGVLEWRFDIKSTATIRNLVQILWFDADQIALGSPSSDLYDNSSTNPTVWTRKQGAITIPATAYFAKARFFGGHPSNAVSGTVNYDNVVITDISQKLEGPDIASAATTDIWDGFFAKHITGTTGITSFGTADYIGQRARVVFDSALLLTHSTNLNIPGGAPFTTSPGDWAYVYADTLTQLDVELFKADGTPINSGISVASKIFAYRNLF